MRNFLNISDKQGLAFIVLCVALYLFTTVTIIVASMIQHGVS